MSEIPLSAKDEDWATRRDVQRVLSISHTTFFKLIKDGALPSFMDGGRRVCRWGDVRAYQRAIETAGQRAA